MNARQEIRKLVQKAVGLLKSDYKGSSLTDVFILVDEESGQISVFDDENNSLVKGIIAEWANKAGETVDYAGDLKAAISEMNKENCFESLDVYTPFSINYADEDFIVLEELLLIEDESIIRLEDEFIKRMDKEFDEFLDRLLKE